MNPDKATYIERIVGWLMPDREDPALAEQARELTTLDGVYRGKSPRIRRLVRLAYLRGCRRGAGCAWSAAQPISLRDAALESIGSEGQGDASPSQLQDPGLSTDDIWRLYRRANDGASTGHHDVVSLCRSLLVARDRIRALEAKNERLQAALACARDSAGNARKDTERAFESAERVAAQRDELRATLERVRGAVSGMGCLGPAACLTYTPDARSLCRVCEIRAALDGTEPDGGG